MKAWCSPFAIKPPVVEVLEALGLQRLQGVEQNHPDPCLLVYPALPELLLGEAVDLPLLTIRCEQLRAQAADQRCISTQRVLQLGSDGLGAWLLDPACPADRQSLEWWDDVDPLMACILLRLIEGDGLALVDYYLALEEASGWSAAATPEVFRECLLQRSRPETLLEAWASVQQAHQAVALAEEQLHCAQAELESFVLLSQRQQHTLHHSMRLQQRGLDLLNRLNPADPV